ncbi:hypothetical protein GCM10014719_56690 [Planomonospora parontospora subsp. antibiotica]|nr:hypothetical protein GCM10014719_56690 [Planomonospora parontospora subsp. antibiotica]GII18789.1 hypothetical protein Ppa05_55150 [Planomonospora parontospora subsp. antibiotica]
MHKRIKWICRAGMAPPLPATTPIQSKGPVFMHAFFRHDPRPATAPSTPDRPPLKPQTPGADARRPAGERH